MHGSGLPLIPCVWLHVSRSSSIRDFQDSPRIGHEDVRIAYSFFRYSCLGELALYPSIFARFLNYLPHFLGDLITIRSGNRYVDSKLERSNGEVKKYLWPVNITKCSVPTAANRDSRYWRHPPMLSIGELWLMIGLWKARVLRNVRRAT